MEKEYAVNVDVTMSGTVYVKAASEEEAQRIVEREMVFTPSDLRNFYHVGPNHVLEVKTEEENENYIEDEYTSSLRGDYSPSCPWNAPGMKVSDFI